MKKLADDFGLTYALGSSFSLEGTERNIISGTVNDKTIKIFDLGIQNRTAIETYFTKNNTPIRSIRHTVLEVNGKETILKSKISGYYPVDKIRSELVKLAQ